jgi:hypothetical protein
MHSRVITISAVLVLIAARAGSGSDETEGGE